MGDNREQRSNLLLRLRRIEGQVRGLQRMVEEEAPCSEVLTQVGAVTAALKKVGTVMIGAHMEKCVAEMAQKTDGNQQRETLRDFQEAMSRYIDWA
jgi:DNA-binding FrmR family transcriptional regulator